MEPNDLLTPESFFALEDITIKKLTVPEKIPVWGGKSLFIKQLSRGQQDAFSKRTSGNLQMKQNTHKKEQIISGISVSGNDAWLCVYGVVDGAGNRIFTEAHIDKLNQKSGEAIGWIAKQIVDFSGMADDDAQKVEQELEYFRMKYPEDAEEYRANHLDGLEGAIKNS
jgi:hypothetical protein